MRKLAAIALIIANLSVAAQGKISKDSSSITDSTVIQELKENNIDNIPVINLEDNDFSSNTSQQISSLLTAGRDPYVNAAAFNFSVLRFKLRGYSSDYSSTYINGINMNNLDNGNASFSLWSGLNDVFKNSDANVGIRYNTFAFGNIGTTTNIDVRASKQRVQTVFGYAVSNRSYDHRFSFTHTSGINKKGWAFSISASKRFASEGYVEGTFYNGYSWFVAVDKKLGQRQLLSLVAFDAVVINGRQSAATDEMMQLAGTHYYNAEWGYQNGKKRNANVSKNNEPVIMLTHEFRLNNKTNITTSALYSFGEKSYSALDWFNAPDPRPDYYRYLPSYYADDAAVQQAITLNLENNQSARQINWDNLYNVNSENNAVIYNANGIAGNTITGNRSYYILGERVTQTKNINFNSVINSRLSNVINFTAGESVQVSHNHYFQRINDLLGGSFWVDVNQFAQRDFPTNENAYQNDLNHPNRIVKAGDNYGYNYDINLSKISAWAQSVFTFNHFDFFIASAISQTIFSRTGNVKNGLFPNDSYGKSAPDIFYNYSAKTGFTYKFNGRNYLYISAAALTHAPYYEDAYISPRTRDIQQDSLRNETIQSFEGGYILNAPKIKLHLVGYYTQSKHGFNVLTFYHDDYQSFVNYALSNIDRLYFGFEFGLEATVLQNVSVTAAAGVGRYYYNSRQKAITIVDNTAAVLNTETIYSNNYRLPSSPQEAYSFSVAYRSPKYWFVSATANYFDEMWLDFNPVRRTATATQNLTKDSETWHKVIDQQKLPSQFTLDVFAGYSWRLKHVYTGSGFNKKHLYIIMYAGINNLLNNQNIIAGGYEQLRYDYSTSDVNKFPPKYYYAYGLNYFVSIAFRL